VVARALFRALMDFFEFGQDFESGRLRRHPVGIARHALDDDPITGFDGQHRLEGGIEKSPVNRLRT
jgi:hypothetical protein